MIPTSRITYNLWLLTSYHLSLMSRIHLLWLFRIIMDTENIRKRTFTIHEVQASLVWSHSPLHMLCSTAPGGHQPQGHLSGSTLSVWGFLRVFICFLKKFGILSNLAITPFLGGLSNFMPSKFCTTSSAALHFSMAVAMRSLSDRSSPQNGFHANYFVHTDLRVQ